MNIILIGNKKYDKINVNSLIDSYKNNYRFNITLPQNNNGTKYDKIVLNNHVFYMYHTKNIDTFTNFYNKTYNISIKYLQKFFKDIVNYNKIEKQIDDYQKFNLLLKNIKCPYLFKKLPRVGYLKIMEYVIKKKNPHIIGFSLLNKKENHIYNNQNVKQSECHDHNSEINILKWLHKNNYIDATLCMLDDQEICTLDCKEIYPKLVTLSLLLEHFNEIYLINYDENEILNIIKSSQITFNKLSHKLS